MAAKTQEVLSLTMPHASASWRWGVVIVPGALVYFLPVPGLDPAQRHLLAIFAATIVSLVARPVPMGVSVVIDRLKVHVP